MELTLRRTRFTSHSTTGTLEIDGAFECYTLEDHVRDDPDPTTRANEAKIAGHTAIPAGRYQVQMTHSQRFKTILPLLVGVPGFEGIRIHAGNTDKDTEGCILVGQTVGEDAIGRSRLALEALLLKLSGAPTWITIIDQPPVEQG